MNKDIKKLIIVFVAFFVTLSTAHLLLYYQTNHKSDKQNCVKFQKIINEEIAFADKELNNLKQVQSLSQLDSLIFNSYTQLFRKKQSGIFLYDSCNLTTWTTNRIPAPLQFDSLETDKTCINLIDGLYIIRTENVANRHIVYLQTIYRNYNYNNEFLNTGFNTLFNLPDNCEISYNFENGYIPIKINDEVAFYIDSNLIENRGQYFISILFFIAFILFLILLVAASNFLIKNNVNRILVLIAFGFDFLILRVLMLKLKYPSALYNLPIFSPEHYAESFWLPSPGDLGINAILLIIWILFFYKIFNPTLQPPNKIIKYIFSISAAAIVISLQAFLSLRIHNIILNSTVEIDPEQIINFTRYSIYLFTIILIFIGAGILLLNKLGKVLYNHINLFVFSITLFVLLIIWILSSHLKINEIIFPISFSLIALILFIVHHKQKPLNWYLYISIIFLVSILLSEKIRQVISAKELETRKVLANNLANERDAGAEFFLINIGNSIAIDNQIKSYTLNNQTRELLNYIQSNYLKGYLSKYELQLSICSFNDSILIQPDNEIKHCYSFFAEMLSERGVPLTGSNFFFLENHDGLISYFGYFDFNYEDQEDTQLFIELKSKLFSEGLGYPELLLDKKYAPKKTLKNYSYAKYNKGKLIVKKGEYEYPYKIDTIKKEADFDLINDGKYSHLMYYPDEENIIVMSSEDKGVQRNLISLSYIFFICFTSFGVFYLIINLINKNKSDTKSLKNRIQLSIVFIIIISLIIIGTISINFIINGYSERHNQMMRDKLQSVLIELEQNIGNNLNTNDINSLLIKLSNIFFTDINLYNTQGNLIASSRNEIFDNGLQGRFMHPKAIRQLRKNNTGMVVISERMGKVNYLSAYVPFRNENNEVIAYINLPYFSRQDELNTEISDFITAFANVFLLLIMLSIIMGIFIANQLTRPLAYLQEKIKNIDLGTRSEKIEYQRKDELGSLIREYNKKIDELAESANLLAKSERESAWREMAKQIAHEIKNPLTPIKLSIQHLKLSYEPNKKNWEQTLNKVTQTIIEQIDTLSAIADEFSNFAKMPQAKFQEIDLNEKILSSIDLFSPSYNNIKFETKIKTNSKNIISADPEQLIRVFTNLIKNSIQAIDQKPNGKIKIKLEAQEHYYLFSISDNGPGISEEMQSKIFVPNFTTKSSGMGLGLSMVKSIIDQMNGEIWFETQLDEGTTFFIKFLK